MKWRHRALVAVAVAATASLTMGTLPAAAVDSSESEPRDPRPPLLLFVHGYGKPGNEDCNETWGKAIDYFEDQGIDRESSIQTISYYSDNEDNCDTSIGNFDNNSGIDHIAAALARHIDGIDRPVNIVAHSMGGLITRVALLGSAKGWTDKYDFPDGKLHNVRNVVTLGTPHQGISQASKSSSVNWQQMVYPDSNFMQVLHAEENQLDTSEEDGEEDGWASGTDWSFVGSSEDATVSYDSAIDRGNHVNQKYGYQGSDDGGEVTHTGIRTLDSGKYALIYWNEDEGGTGTQNGWSPLETAYNATTDDDQDGQP